MSLRLYKEVNLIENPSLINQLNKLFLIILLGAVPIFVVIAIRYLDLTSIAFRFADILNSIAVYIALIFIHEALHGLFFKLFKPSAKIQFGFKKGMAYASSIGNKYGRLQTLVILMAPFTVITAGLFISSRSGWMSAYVFLLNAIFHTSSCVGDFYFAYLILKAPGKAIIEDTKTGIRIYQAN